MQNTPTPLRTEHIQIRLHVPQLIDQFQQTQDDVMLSMWANYKPTMILNAPGEQFEDPQRKIRITWKGMTTSVSPAQALIHVEKLP
jgi:hypothetical protein